MIPFQPKQDFSQRLKGKDIKDFEQAEILTEGEWQEDTFKDGSISKGFWVKIKYKGQEKEVKVTRDSWNSISQEYGEDTSGWIGKPVILMTHQYEKGVGISIKPKPAIAFDD